MTRHGKTRVVSFRLSEGEYQHLVESCAARGARNLSEIARLIVSDVIYLPGSEGPESLAKRIGQLDRDVVALNSEVKSLAEIIHSALRPGQAENRTEQKNDEPSDSH